MQRSGEPLFVVVERSAAGEQVLGVFSTLDGARAVLPPASSGRLGDYRVEYRVLDEPPALAPWQVGLTRQGGVLSAEVVVTCACADDERRLAQRCFLEAGGQRLYVVAWATSAGEAIAAAQALRAWLLERGAWGEEARPLAPISAELALVGHGT